MEAGSFIHGSPSGQSQDETKLVSITINSLSSVCRYQTRIWNLFSLKVMFVSEEVYKLKILGISVSVLKQQHHYCGLYKVNVLQMSFNII